MESPSSSCRSMTCFSLSPVAVIGIQTALPVGDIAVSVPQRIQPLLHPFLSNVIHHLPEVPDAGGMKGILKTDIPVPFPVPEVFPAPFPDRIFRINHAVFQRQQRRDDFKGGTGRSSRLRQLRIVYKISVFFCVIQNGGAV